MNFLVYAFYCMAPWLGVIFVLIGAWLFSKSKDASGVSGSGHTETDGGSLPIIVGGEGGGGE
jgi:hypothetical protein